MSDSGSRIQTGPAGDGGGGLRGGVTAICGDAPNTEAGAGAERSRGTACQRYLVGMEGCAKPGAIHEL